MSRGNLSLLSIACQPPNKQLQRPVVGHRGDAARAPFHYARASRSHWRRAAAELQRSAATMTYQALSDSAKTRADERVCESAEPWQKR